MDVMLDLPEMKNADPQMRKRRIAERVLVDVPQVLSKYEIDDFDFKRFISDLHTWIETTGWISN